MTTTPESTPEPTSCLTLNRARRILASTSTATTSQLPLRPLPPELAKMAREEVNETPDRIQQDLIILRVWIRQQAHLKARVSDEFLIAVLRRCRYSLEMTKKRIDAYFTFYTILPEILAKRGVSRRLLDINRLGIYCNPEVPKCDSQAIVMIARFGAFDYRKYSIREILRYTTMVTEVVALENDYAAIAGVYEVIDMTNVTFDLMFQVDRMMFKKWWIWCIECCLLRVKQAFIINVPKDMQRRVAMLKTIRPHQSQIQIKILKNTEELYKYIPRDCLPEEYGGSNGHIAECVAYMEDLLRNYRGYFAEDGDYGTREELRSGEIVPYEAEFGVSGSFRKLSNVD